MTPALAQEYIKGRMHQLGYGDKYHLRFKHFVLQGSELRTEKAYGSFYILVEDPLRILITSQNGMYDLASTNTNELQYEHHGLIKIKNTGVTVARVRFIQVIPFT